MKFLIFLILIHQIFCDKVGEYSYIKNLLKKGSTNLQKPLDKVNEKLIDFNDNYVMIFPKQSSTASFTDTLNVKIDKIEQLGEKSLDNLPNISLRMVDLNNFSYKTYPSIEEGQVYTYIDNGEKIQFALIFDTNETFEEIYDNIEGIINDPTQKTDISSLDDFWFEFDDDFLEQAKNKGLEKYQQLPFDDEFFNEYLKLNQDQKVFLEENFGLDQQFLDTYKQLEDGESKLKELENWGKLQFDGEFFEKYSELSKKDQDKFWKDFEGNQKNYWKKQSESFSKNMKYWQDETNKQNKFWADQFTNFDKNAPLLTSPFDSTFNQEYLKLNDQEKVFLEENLGISESLVNAFNNTQQIDKQLEELENWDTFNFDGELFEKLGDLTKAQQDKFWKDFGDHQKDYWKNYSKNIQKNLKKAQKDAQKANKYWADKFTPEKIKQKQQKQNQKTLKSTIIDQDFENQYLNLSKNQKIFLEENFGISQNLVDNLKNNATVIVDKQLEKLEHWDTLEFDGEFFEKLSDLTKAQQDKFWEDFRDYQKDYWSKQVKNIQKQAKQMQKDADKLNQMWADKYTPESVKQQWIKKSQKAQKALKNQKVNTPFDKKFYDQYLKLDSKQKTLLEENFGIEQQFVEQYQNITKKSEKLEKLEDWAHFAFDGEFFENLGELTKAEQDQFWKDFSNNQKSYWTKYTEDLKKNIDKLKENTLKENQKWADQFNTKKEEIKKESQEIIKPFQVQNPLIETLNSEEFTEHFNDLGVGQLESVKTLMGIDAELVDNISENYQNDDGETIISDFFSNLFAQGLFDQVSEQKLHEKWDNLTKKQEQYWEKVKDQVDTEYKNWKQWVKYNAPKDLVQNQKNLIALDGEFFEEFKELTKEQQDLIQEILQLDDSIINDILSQGDNLLDGEITIVFIFPLDIKANIFDLKKQEEDIKNGYKDVMEQQAKEGNGFWEGFYKGKNKDKKKFWKKVLDDVQDKNQQWMKKGQEIQQDVQKQQQQFQKQNNKKSKITQKRNLVYVSGSGRAPIQIKFSITNDVQRGTPSWIASSIVVGVFIFVSLILGILIIIFNKRLHRNDAKFAAMQNSQQIQLQNAGEDQGIKEKLLKDGDMENQKRQLSFEQNVGDKGLK